MSSSTRRAARVPGPGRWSPSRGCAVHARAMSAWVSWGHPKARQIPTFHSIPRGISGHFAMPRARGGDALPDVDEGVPDDAEVSAVRAARNGPARSWSPWNRARDGRRARRIGGWRWAARAVSRSSSRSTPCRNSTTTPLDAEIGAPDLLHQLGIVSALDEDATGQRDACALIRDDERSGCGAPRTLFLRRRHDESAPVRAARRDRPAKEQASDGRRDPPARRCRPARG